MQIAFFIGLFQHLEDLELHLHLGGSEGGLTLVPPFVPPLRGHLAASGSLGRGVVKHMVHRFGGVRFRHMNLFHMGGTQLLLYGCANALESLSLDAADICGEKPSSKDMKSLTNDFTGKSSDRDLDLSRNGSLQELEITAQSLISVLKERAPGTVPGSFRAMISTINSPVFSVVVVYQVNDFYNAAYSWEARVGLGDEDTWYHRQFEVFREMYKAWDFRLVLKALCVGDVSMRELERGVAVEKAKGGLPPELSVTYTLAGY